MVERGWVLLVILNSLDVEAFKCYYLGKELEIGMHRKLIERDNIWGTGVSEDLRVNESSRRKQKNITEWDAEMEMGQKEWFIDTEKSKV